MVVQCCRLRQIAEMTHCRMGPLSRPSRHSRNGRDNGPILLRFMNNPSLALTADYYGVGRASVATEHSKSSSRDVAAWLARRHAVATLREPAEPFGLGHLDSVRGLVDRTEKAMARFPKLRREIEQLKKQLQDR